MRSSCSSGFPHATVGTRAASSSSKIGSPACVESSSTPSTCPARTKRVTRARSSAPPAIIRIMLRSDSARRWEKARSRTLKFGSSNSRSCGSDSTTATAPERRVTSARALVLTT